MLLNGGLKVSFHLLTVSTEDIELPQLECTTSNKKHLQEMAGGSIVYTLCSGANRRHHNSTSLGRKTGGVQQLSCHLDKVQVPNEYVCRLDGPSATRILDETWAHHAVP